MPKPSLWSRLTSILCSPVDNAFTLEKFMDGRLLMVGDRVSIRRRFLPRSSGRIVRLEKHRHIDNFQTESAHVLVGSRVHRICLERLELIERSASYRDHWTEVYEIEDDEAIQAGLRRRDEEDDPPQVLAGWVTSDFSWGVVLLALGREDWATRFLERVLGRADQLLSGDSLDSVPLWRDSLYPGLVKSRVYAAALMGHGWDSDALLEAARRVQARSDDIEPFYWSSDKQDQFLSAVRMALIAGDFEFARELLTSRRSFSGHKDQRALLKKIVRKTIPPSRDVELMERCAGYLDFVRRPHTSNHCLFGGTLRALEWGAIVQGFDRRAEDVDMRQVASFIYR